MKNLILFVCALFVMIQTTSAQTTASISNNDSKTEKKVQELNMKSGLQQATFDNLAGYVATHLEYPETARENALEGTVKVKVTISPAGEVLNAEVTESLGFGCDEAALKLVRNMPRWKPASNFGIPVTGKGILTFKFSLQ